MSKQHLLTITDVLERIPSDERSNGTRELIEHAYVVAEQAHAGQTRKSGEPYIQHPLAVALLLTNLGMDPDTVAAGLLHDVAEDSEMNVERLAHEFGPDVASLVDGVTKLEQIDRFSHKSEGLRDARESESLRKMFIAMAEDTRVVIIKPVSYTHLRAHET